MKPCAAVGTIRILIISEATCDLRAQTHAHAIVAASRDGENPLEALGRG